MSFIKNKGDLLMDIPKNHPRYESLHLRELIADGYEKGLVDRTGLIAHGRGEAFDYLLGERTLSEADSAARVASAHLLLAKNPVISVNGNTAVIVPDDLVEMAELIPARLEVNLFHRTQERIEKLIEFLKSHGAVNVLGRNPDANLPNLNQPRGLCTEEGIFNSDVILVPLEDGDRAEALAAMKKTVIVVDLNPLSRSSKYGTVTIVDNISRATKVIIEHVKELKETFDKTHLNNLISGYDNKDNLSEIIRYLNVNQYKNYK
jgi:4-phosphopantoate--beta-alanine ligase